MKSIVVKTDLAISYDINVSYSYHDDVNSVVTEKVIMSNDKLTGTLEERVALLEGHIMTAKEVKNIRNDYKL